MGEADVGSRGTGVEGGADAQVMRNQLIFCNTTLPCPGPSLVLLVN